MKKVLSLLSRIEKHDAGVYSLFFSSENPFPKFKAGQFLHLALDDYDPSGGFWPESRVFSIASRSGRDEIRIIYSVKGAFTHRMEEELSEGRPVWLKIPYGDFYVSESEQNPVVLVSGGTGISPFVPFIENIVSEGKVAGSVHVLYGCRATDQLIFLPLLDEAKKTVPNFDYTVYVEELSSHGENIGAKQGRISLNDAVFAKSSKVYLSGPPSMIFYFKSNLPAIGVAPENIFIDAWE